ncbi:hypothetical protein GOQ27_13985 [Clostridium sp. D2Q-11]|uniref:Uncharacterized protein n=1 Tax=Anaeromonas frigoriresistens TaxID=2683708 RepID=A0A942UWW4_9FIRM|nr:hypothetical protein [Anaeromonas frigoriresistens]MBS4539580.1 hypothetical protein [Anaeromonas frigoriresistens]
MKKRLIIILISVTVLLTLSIDYGWRIFGFDACSSSIPSVTEIKVEDNTVNLRGTTYYSADHFVGHITEIKDKTLYVGMRYQLFTIFHGGGSFNINISLKNVDIDKIYIKGKSSSELIWEKENKKE